MVNLPAMNTDNLWKPLLGDHGAHGRFTKRSVSASPLTWVNERLPAVAAVAAAAVLALALRR